MVVDGGCISTNIIYSYIVLHRFLLLPLVWGTVFHYTSLLPPLYLPVSS